MANETALAQGLLDDTWSPRVRRDVNFTGALWEYVVSFVIFHIECMMFLLKIEYHRVPTGRIRAWIYSLDKVIIGEDIRLLF